MTVAVLTIGAIFAASYFHLKSQADAAPFSIRNLSRRQRAVTVPCLND